MQDSGFKYTPDWTIWSSKFQNFSGEGLTEPPPQTPPPALSRASPSILASPSNLGRFTPSFRASSDSDPPNFWSVAAPLTIKLFPAPDKPRRVNRGGSGGKWDWACDNAMIGYSCNLSHNQTNKLTLKEATTHYTELILISSRNEFIDLENINCEEIFKIHKTQ